MKRAIPLGKDSRRQGLASEELGVGGAVPGGDPHERQQPVADLSDPLLADVDRRARHSLQQAPHLDIIPPWAVGALLDSIGA